MANKFRGNMAILEARNDRSKNQERGVLNLGIEYPGMRIPGIGKPRSRNLEPRMGPMA